MSKTNLSELIEDEEEDVTEFKDGDGDVPDNVDQLLIEFAANGFMITVFYDDGSHDKYIRKTYKEIIEFMKDLS